MLMSTTCLGRGGWSFGASTLDAHPLNPQKNKKRKSAWKKSLCILKQPIIFL
jgi:hypothetical protein